MGSGQFADVVLAAYMLYCIYDDFRGTVGYTGSIDEEWLCGWIKHLIGDELPVSFAIGKYFEILHPCFRYNGKFFKNANFRSFPISNGNKTHFLKKSQFHFKKKQAFSGFLAFPIIKETSGCLKTLFPFFVPAATQYIFLRKREKPQPVRVFQLSVVFSSLL